MSKYVWIARDSDGTVWAFYDKPYYCAFKHGEWAATTTVSAPLDDELFPDIKPGECVRFKLIRDDEGGER